MDAANAGSEEAKKPEEATRGEETERILDSEEASVPVLTQAGAPPGGGILTGANGAGQGPGRGGREIWVSRRRPGPDSERDWTAYGIALLIFIALLSAFRSELYPVFVDTYYHMAAIAGLNEAGGLPTWAFWEMAPGGRPHIYPPALHVLGHLASLAGVSPKGFIAFVSWAFYPLSFLTAWLWLRSVAGARAAFFAVALLSAPAAWFWNQTAHTANALTMVLAPLALLALERERFLACAVLNFVATAAHPMGLFLPPALALNALLRRKRLSAGLLAAAAPVVLYVPWLAHIWANRAFLPPSRLGGSSELVQHGFQASLIALPLAVVGLGRAFFEGRERLGLFGPLLGFAVVLPIGFGNRFFTFNVHWPLAALAGLGAARCLEALDFWLRSRAWANALTASLAFFTLVAYPGIHARPPPPGAISSEWFLALQPSSLVLLLDPRSQPEPGFGPPPPEREMAPERPVPGMPGRPGPRPGPVGPDFLHRRGAERFFANVRKEVPPDAIIFVEDPPLASLLSGATSRRTTSGILRDVRPLLPPPSPLECDFAVTLGPERYREPREALKPPPAAGPPGFEIAYENPFGTLWRNPSPPVRKLAAPAPALKTHVLLALSGIGLILLIVDLLTSARLRSSSIIPSAAFVAAAMCMAPLCLVAMLEFRHPPRPAADVAQEFSPRAPPVELRDLHRKIQEAIPRVLENGGDPRAFWSPEDERRFHELARSGRFEDARRLLEEAAKKLEELEAKPKTGLPENDRAPDPLR